MGSFCRGMGRFGVVGFWVYCLVFFCWGKGNKCVGCLVIVLKRVFLGVLGYEGEVLGLRFWSYFSGRFVGGGIVVRV